MLETSSSVTKDVNKEVLRGYVQRADCWHMDCKGKALHLFKPLHCQKPRTLQNQSWAKDPELLR